MRAIILPLSEIVYNFEKHNGKAFGERMCIKYPAYNKFIHSKFGNGILLIFLVAPLFIVLAAFYFLPRYFILIVRFGYAKAKIKMHSHLDKLLRRFNLDSGILLKKVKKIVERHQKDNAVIFIFYTSDMVPKKKRRQNKFFDKLKSMQKEFKIDHIQQANTKEDIETLIWLFDIDRVELFLATMLLENSTPQLFIPLKPIPGMYTEAWIKDNDIDPLFMQENTFDNNLSSQRISSRQG